uniref:Uncharacterized protein n=4 Tax=Noccaea caerulescens TaxID=107243 RepID=A0A1J3J6U5_NOCCA
MFSNFVENFDLLIGELTFDPQEYLQINLKMINYLEKHLVYKKLWKHYIVQALLATPQNAANTPEVDALVLKLLSSGEVDQETVALALRTQLKGNRFYSFLQQLLVGDYEAFSSASKESLNGHGVEVSDL